MKKALIALLALSISFLASDALASQQKANEKNVLFIQIADKGTLNPIEDKPGSYQLTLTGVKEYVQFFTDRPVRKAGIYPTGLFLGQWQQGTKKTSFNKMPPNAALSAIETHLFKNKMVNTVLQLSSPMYNANQHSLTYVVRPLKGLDNSIPQRQFKNVALFIDNYCASCSGGGF